MPNIEELKADLLTQFGDAISDVSEPYGFLTITMDRTRIEELAQYVFDHPVFKVRFLTDITGIHYPDRKGEEIACVWHFHSFENNLRFRVKAYASDLDPTFPTLVRLHAGSNWMERETYDNMGLIFEGHPDLRRILNVDDMDYFPLRKEFPLEDPTRRDKNDAMFGRDANI